MMKRLEEIKKRLERNKKWETLMDSGYVPSVVGEYKHEDVEWLIEKVLGLYEYNDALQETSILNGELVVKHEETLKEIKTHCIHCDADNRAIQPYEILDILNS